MTSFVQVPASGGGPGGGNYQTVQAAGTPVAQEPVLNFAASLSVADEPLNTRTNVGVVFGSAAATAVEGNDVRVTRPKIVVVDSKAAGTPGGIGAAGWNTRALNSALLNTLGATLAANQLTNVPAGTYQVQAWAPAFKCDAHRLRIRNITAGTTLVLGSIAYSYSVENPQTHAVLIGTFVLAAPSTLELQHFIQNPPAAPNDVYTFGSESGPADTEAGIFAQLLLERIA